jgi:hypothetical protein
VHGISDEVVSDAFLQLLKAKKVILCPTLDVSLGYYQTFAQTLCPTLHEIQTANPASLVSLFKLPELDSVLANRVKNRARNITIYAIEDSIRSLNLKRMSDAGITIATGTDAGNIGTQHAASYLSELLSMQKSGMSNWQILQASTLNGMKILDKEEHYGSIQKGKIADLVLLNANPLDNLENVGDIHLVFKLGVTIHPDTLIKETPEMVAQRMAIIAAVKTRCGKPTQ